MVNNERRIAAKAKRLGLTPGKYEELANYGKDDQIVSSFKMAKQLKKRPRYIIRVKSLIPSLDRHIEWFNDGELIVISGPTKGGKTLLIQTLATNFAKQKHFPVCFSFEVPPRDFYSKFSNLPQFYQPGQLTPASMPWVKDRIYESFIKRKSRIVIIDHLHFLVELNQANNLSRDVGGIIRDLKTLAIKSGLIIFLIAHLKTGDYQGEKLSYADIRDSSFIAQESDSVLMIRRTPKSGENAAQLTVEFHRRTGVLKKTIDLVKYKGLLVEKSQLASILQQGKSAKSPVTIQKSERVHRRRPKKEEKNAKEDQ